MRIKIVTALVSAALGVGALFGYVATLTAATDRPYCPTEDSCTPDYDGWTNSWTVTEDRP